VIDEEGDERQPDLGYDDAPTKFAAFADAVQTGEDPPATVGDVYVVTALLEAAYESARTGDRITVDLD
jgi:predicted dehydrogenase